MQHVQAAYKKMYPRGVFYSNIIVNKLIDNETSCSGYGLTFSGGVDSTYSLISNLEKKPTLIMYLGADINLDAKKARGRWTDKMG